MPGGDKAALEPWRMAVAYLHHYQLPVHECFINRIGEEKVKAIIELINKKINSPYTSSIGRLFDGFASLTKQFVNHSKYSFANLVYCISLLY